MKLFRLIFILTLGISLGAAFGTLFAPKKGSETRSDLAKSTKKAIDSTTKYFNKMEKKADKVGADVTRQIDDYMTRINQGDESAKSQFNNFLNEIDEVVNQS